MPETERSLLVRLVNFVRGGGANIVFSANGVRRVLPITFWSSRRWIKGVSVFEFCWYLKITLLAPMVRARRQMRKNNLKDMIGGLIWSVGYKCRVFVCVKKLFYEQNDDY